MGYRFKTFQLQNFRLTNSKHLQTTKQSGIKINECGRIDNIVGKGENVDYQHFLLFSQCFSKDLFPTFVKTQNFLVRD